MISFIPEDSVEFICYISRLKKPFELFNLNDYCILPYPNYIENKINYDILLDMGLSPKPGYLYGKIIGDFSYKNYNPHSPSLKVAVLIHDDDNKLIYTDYESIKQIELEKINKLEINYFKLYGEN